MYEVNSDKSICIDQCRVFRKITRSLSVFHSRFHAIIISIRTKECNNRVKTTVSLFFQSEIHDLAEQGTEASDPKLYYTVSVSLSLSTCTCLRA